MRQAVLDASAILCFLLNPSGFRFVGSLLADQRSRLFVPFLCDAEVLSGLRRLLLTGVVPGRRANEALADYSDLPLERFPHLPCARRALSLWQNMSSADALYVALAESIAVPLVTSDSRLARAARNHSQIEVVDTSGA